MKNSRSSDTELNVFCPSAPPDMNSEAVVKIVDDLVEVFRSSVRMNCSHEDIRGKDVVEISVCAILASFGRIMFCMAEMMSSKKDIVTLTDMASDIFEAYMERIKKQFLEKTDD